MVMSLRWAAPPPQPVARVLTVCRHPAGSAEPLGVGSVRVDVPRPGSRTGRHSQQPPGQRPCSQPTFSGLLARDWQAQPPFGVVGEPGPRHPLDTARGRGWLSQRAGVCAADSIGRGRGAAQLPQARPLPPSLPPPAVEQMGEGQWARRGAGRAETGLCLTGGPRAQGASCAHMHRAHTRTPPHTCTLTPARSHTCRPGCVATCIWCRVTADTQQDPVPVPQGAWPPPSATLLPLRERPGLPGAEGTRAEGAVGNLSGPIKHKPRCLTPPSQEPQGAASLTPGRVPGTPAPGRSWGAAETWLCDACRPASLPRPRPAAPRPPG